MRQVMEDIKKYYERIEKCVDEEVMSNPIAGES